MLETFTHFLNCSPTSYHASKQIANSLKKEGFIPLFEKKKWDLQPTNSYFLIRENSLLAAFRLPKKDPISATILACHLDSPALKIKPIAQHNKGSLNVEMYGGPTLFTWFDRDLTIAGRIITLEKNGECKSQIINLDLSLIIPSLGIHLDRTINEEGFKIQKQEHLRPIYSLNVNGKSLSEYLFKHFSFQKLLSFDLFLVPKEKASFLGMEREFISSYRIDNLSSAYAILEALSSTSSREDCIQMALFWDHEEIGSTTYAGANSLFVNEVLERICLSYQMQKEVFYQLKSNSFCLSCDTAHGYHPNFSKKYDPDNAPTLGMGPVIKYSPRYATSATTAASIAIFQERQNIPLQTYASHSDIRSGGTVGAMMAAFLGIRAVDLGISCWAMHSIRETIAAKDELWLIQLLKAALEEPLLHPKDLCESPTF